MIMMVVEKLITKKISGFAAHVCTYGVRINVNEIADRWMKRSEYGTTSFVFLNKINSSAPAIKKKLPLIRIGYYAKGETSDAAVVINNELFNVGSV